MSVRVEHGDSREVIKTLADCSVDAVVTDPPYSLVSIQKRFGKPGSAPVKVANVNASNDLKAAYARASAGFMGKQWDTGETAFDPAFWVEVLRVLKPGGHLLAFGGTRTYHRLACAIEDAGFEVRDQIGWAFGAGFPKNHNVSRNCGDAVCRCGSETERDMRPVRNSDVSATRTSAGQPGQILFNGMPEQGAPGAMLRPESEEGGSGISECRVEGRRDLSPEPRQLRERSLRAMPGGVSGHGEGGRLCDGTSASDGETDRAPVAAGGSGAPCGSQAAEQRAVEPGAVAGQSQPQDGGAWPHCGRCGKPIVPDGLGTALKPAWEPICLARKPLIGTVAANVLQHGTGALNIDGCRVASEGGKARENEASQDRRYSEHGATNFAALPGPRGGGENGRWPANLIHDGSEEVLRAFPEAPGALRAVGPEFAPKMGTAVYGDYGPRPQVEPRGDSGSAARFFYQAKADADDRLGSKHPTVKPVDLMAYLCRLVTPPGGLVLDPFAGSGSTGMACMREGFDCILIEREAEYVADIRRRLDHVSGADTPLFAEKESDDAAPPF